MKVLQYRDRNEKGRDEGTGKKEFEKSSGEKIDTALIAHGGKNGVQHVRWFTSPHWPGSGKN